MSGPGGFEEIDEAVELMGIAPAGDGGDGSVLSDVQGRVHEPALRLLALKKLRAVEVVKELADTVEAVEERKGRSGMSGIGEHMNRPERHGMGAVAIVHGDDEFVDVEGCAGWGVETQVSVGTKTKMGQRGQHAEGAVAEVDGADIVGQETIAAAEELGRERGFADALGTDKDHGAPAGFDGAAVEGEESALIEERTEDGAHQKQADLLRRSAGEGLDGDAASLLDEIAADALDGEAKGSGADLVIAVFKRRRSLGKRRQEADRDVRGAIGMRIVRQSGAGNLSADTEAINAIGVSGHHRLCERHGSSGASLRRAARTAVKENDSSIPEMEMEREKNTAGRWISAGRALCERKRFKCSAANPSIAREGSQVLPRWIREAG